MIHAFDSSVVHTIIDVHGASPGGAAGPIVYLPGTISISVETTSVTNDFHCAISEHNFEGTKGDCPVGGSEGDVVCRRCATVIPAVVLKSARVQLGLVEIHLHLPTAIWAARDAHRVGGDVNCHRWETMSMPMSMMIQRHAQNLCTRAI